MESQPDERVIAALTYDPRDRGPVQLSFMPTFAALFKIEFSLAESDLHKAQGGGDTYLIEREVGKAIRLTFISKTNSYFGDKDTKMGSAYVDDRGVTRKSVGRDMPFVLDRYAEMVVHLLACDAACNTYEPPDASRPELYVKADQGISEFKRDCWIVNVTVTTMLEFEGKADYAKMPGVSKLVQLVAIGIGSKAHLLKLDRHPKAEERGEQNMIGADPPTWQGISFRDNFVDSKSGRLGFDLNEAERALLSSAKRAKWERGDT